MVKSKQVLKAAQIISNFCNEHDRCINCAFYSEDTDVPCIFMKLCPAVIYNEVKTRLK